MAMHVELSKRLVISQLKEALAQEGLFSDRVQLEEVSYPTFFVRFINRQGTVRLLRFEGTDYDFQPMAVDPIDPIRRTDLVPEHWPLRGSGAFPGHFMKGGRPFFCISGVRDYYTHEGHSPSVTGQRWEMHRATHRIPDLLAFIANKFATGSWT
jgi:hypothetical protein